jgi:hypothetical protein
MKRTYPYPPIGLLHILLLLSSMLYFSCLDSRDIPNTDIVGSWETAHFSSEIGFESVVTYTFQADGTYAYEWGYRTQGTSSNLGYQLVWHGNYRTTSNGLFMQVRHILSPPSTVTRPPFVPKNELVNVPHTIQPEEAFTFRLAPDKATLTIRSAAQGSHEVIYTKVN